MKVLITGANGLLGTKLVEELVERGENFLATSKGDSRFGEEVPYTPMDVTSSEEVEEVILAFKPEIVIHTAAMTQVDDCEQQQDLCYNLNVTAVENIVKACKKAKSFLIHLSTDFIFNGKKGPLSENEEPDPVNYYGKTKLQSEELVMNSKINWAIVRTVLVYGVTKNMSRSNIILWVKKSLEEGKEIQVVDDQYRTPTLAEDLAAGCLLIAENKAKGIFNISGKDFLNPYEMAIKTAKFFKLNSALIKKTNSEIFKQPAKRPLRTGFIINKAIEKLRYNPHSFDKGIEIIASQI